MTRTKKTAHKKSVFRRYLWPCLAIIFVIGIVAGALFLSLGLNQSEKTELRLHISQPSPITFTDNNNQVFISSASIPDINNNRTLTNAQHIEISYNWLSGPYNPAFNINLDDSDLAKYVKISPLVHGKFSIKNPYTITFTPDAPWPADTKYTVRISKRLFSKDVHPDRYSATFSTKKIAATLDSFNTYPSPDNPKKLIGVAILSFNYPINTEHFADKVSMRLDGKKIKFDIKFDRFHRTAFVISEPISVIDQEQDLRLKLNRVSAMYGHSDTEKITGSTIINAQDNFFRITSLESIVADDSENNARQLILIQTSAPAAGKTDWKQHINAYLLPQHKDNSTSDNNHIWQSDEITPEVLLNSKKIKLSLSDFVTPVGVNQYAFAYNIPNPSPRYLYIDITPGAKSVGDFTMKNGLNTVVPVSYPEQSVKIAGSGALLSMSGEKKLGIMTRGGVHDAYIKLYKIKSSEINHLISQTYNVFASDIEFKSWSFGTYDMSVVFEKRIPLNVSNAIETNYASLDLGDYMDRVSNDKTGIFIIQAGTSENDAEFNDKRLVVVTDLGIIRKLNTDGTSALFVSKLSNGGPVPDAQINVLGRNGNPIWSGRTDTNGRADIPALPWNEYKNARAPVAIVARLNDDVSFIPYDAAHSQHVQYSKFDTGGQYSYTDVPLKAFLFSDRGIYRPGETAIIGAIVKNKSFKSPEGVPVKVSVTDPRGRIIFEKNISLHSDGMFDIQVPISASAAIGEYSVNVYSLNVRATPQDLLGTTTFSVAEFSPDTMKINAVINGATSQGWIFPNTISTDIDLRNLFGTPASNRRVSIRATLRPLEFKFDNLSQYNFVIDATNDTPMSSSSPINNQTYVKTIDNIYTDSNGFVHADIRFDTPIPNGTYLLTATINGFEPNSGKSVQTTITSRCSNAKYLIGHHTNTNLKYINRNSGHKIDFIALDHTSAPIAVNDLTVRFVHRDKLTSLIKDYNNFYKYQTTNRDTVVSQEKITLATTGASIPLITEKPGTYFVQILDAADKVISNIEYFVAGDGNPELNTIQSSEMEITLNSETYTPGDEIQINITTPYPGHGLITIERDNVYAYKWFKADQTSSVQKIKLPADFEGTGYINVSFIRSIDSRDIFTSPYTYAVVPFSTDIKSRTIDVTLNAPKIIRDNKLNIEYESSQSGRMMLFAIDEGILQVARFKTPNPLKYFFAKSALQVETFQILSLLLPEYKILREFAKTGGGDFDAPDTELSSPLSNPFARRILSPVAFYSGIIDVTANTKNNITFDVPDNFNGTLRIYAIITNDVAAGASEIETTVQSPLVISVSNPTFVAPGDTFEINALIANLTDISDGINIQTDIVTSDNIKITSGAQMENHIQNGDDHLFIFHAQTENTPGASEITINASAVNDNGLALINRSMTSSISVRPATPFETHIKTDIINKKHETIKRFHIDMYPEHATQTLYISQTPAILIKPLFEYLSKYDFTCTEQLVSKAIPYVLLPDNTILGTNYNVSSKKIGDTINTLKNRQNPDGSFALWPTSTTHSTDKGNAELTAYVVHFLSMARQNGFSVPDTMLGRAIDFLREFAGTTITTPEHAHAIAYAIYVLTTNGYVTTSYIDKFQEYADKNISHWESEISGVYIGASFQIMRQSDRAQELIQQYKLSKHSGFKYMSAYSNNVSDDATYLYILNTLFNTPITYTGNAITGYINRGNYDAFTSAKIVMGLNGAATDNSAPSSVKILYNDAPLDTHNESNILIAQVPTPAETLDLECLSCTHDAPLYYALVTQGFATTASDESNGIEISRTYYDENSNRIASAKLGDIVTVKISARARGTNYLPDIAITDLLPGGFVAEDVIGPQTFSEIREDRVIIYTDLTRDTSEFTYTAQITAAGTFAIPAINAISMYNPDITATKTPTSKTFSVLSQVNE